MEEHVSKHEISSIVPEGVLEALAALDDEKAIATIMDPKLLTFGVPCTGTTSAVSDLLV